VSWGRDRDNEEHLRTILAELRNRKRKPLFVKVPPFRTAAERDAVLAVVKIAQDGGADGLTCSNTYPVQDGRLSVGAGGLSGREIFEDTLRIVADVRRATGGVMPINACGGVVTPDDALACIEAGATTVQVYTGFVYEGPRIVRDITTGLAAALSERRADLSSLVGAAAS
jgi:dihydroorotate dehydrogenase